MNEQVKSVIASISKWNSVKSDKTEVFSLWEKCSSFKIVLPIKSDCNKNFHIYFGVQKSNQTHSDTIVMHLIADNNDQPELIKNFENADDYIFSAELGNLLNESAEIDEAEAMLRILAWQNPVILKEYLEKNPAFDVFTIGKDDFLVECGYSAYFGMKLDKEDLTSYIPDIIIQNYSRELTTSYYDLARICPPYNAESIFGLQELSY